MKWHRARCSSFDGRFSHQKHLTLVSPQSTQLIKRLQQSCCGSERRAFTTCVRGLARASEAQLLSLDNRLLIHILTLSVSVSWCSVQTVICRSTQEHPKSARQFNDIFAGNTHCSLLHAPTLTLDTMKCDEASIHVFQFDFECNLDMQKICTLDVNTAFIISGSSWVTLDQRWHC